MSNFNLKSSTTITIVSIFPIIKFYKSALARPQVARDNLGEPVGQWRKQITLKFLIRFLITKSLERSLTYHEADMFSNVR